MFKGSIPALITPFTEVGEIDFEAFDSLVEWHIAKGSDAIVLCGMTGEGPALTVEEQGQLIARGVKLAKGRIPLIAGTGVVSTQLTVALTEQAKRAGADACLVIVPYCNRPTPEGCLQHYQAVSRVALPMIVYHHPSRTNVRLPLLALKAILSLPHVIGVKEGSADLAYTAELMHQTPVPVFCGDDILALAMLAQGARGVISIVANVIPEEWQRFCTYLLQGNLPDAQALFFQVQPLIEAMTLEINPQCVKYALSLQGKCLPNMRLPLVQPHTETQTQIQAAVKKVVLVDTNASTFY
jgi:4-hydroxy-tetrahydrodipicolinate synthase